MRWTSRVAVGIVVTALLISFGVAPVAARPLEDYGATYACRYRTIEGTSPAMGDLRRIVVTPPIMFGDEYEQTVGWRLIVRRYLDDDETGTTKVTTWRSQIRKAVAYEGQQADFQRIVYSPPDLPAAGVWDQSYLMASIRLIWYGQDGSVQRSNLHEFGSAYTYVDGELWYHSYDSSCPQPKQLEFIDGPF